MALMKANEVPKDAIELDEVAATIYVWDLVSNWEALTDVWALRFSPGVLGGVSAVSGIIINNHFRMKLKLGNYGYFSSVLPVSIIPGIMTALFHRHTVSTDMLLMKHHSCPMCFEVRSAAIQLGSGIAYPMLLAPTTATMLANRYNTFRVPSLTEAPKELLKFVLKITRPLHKTLMYLAGIQLVMSSVMTYLEMGNNKILRVKMMEIEEMALRKQHDGELQL